jgi:hypothetical protein
MKGLPLVFLEVFFVSYGSDDVWFVVLQSLCLGSRSVGIMVRCCVFILSSCSPSWVASRACRDGSACGDIISCCVCVLKSLKDLFPRLLLTIGHLLPLFFSN